MLEPFDRRVMELCLRLLDLGVISREGDGAFEDVALGVWQFLTGAGETWLALDLLLASVGGPIHMPPKEREAAIALADEISGGDWPENSDPSFHEATDYVDAMLGSRPPTTASMQNWPGREKCRLPTAVDVGPVVDVDDDHFS